MKPMKFLYFLFFTSTWFFSRHIRSQELTDDLDKNESQIEVPPIILPNEGNFLETGDKDNNAINQNVKSPPELPPKDEIELKLSLENKTVETSEDINKLETANENLTIPVYSEWTLQQMQEAENKNTNSSEQNKEIKNETLAKHQILKMRQKNYASPDCGAKILASNPEAQSTSAVLTDKDEYLLSPCTDRIWFIVELCDSIQAQRVELANFELFSSPLKSVSISVSNRFPTRDWTFSGQFDAKSERDVQVLELSSSLFGKFVRVDLTYFNTEHYCPLSFFRIFGTSEIEAFEVENEPADEFKNTIDEEAYENHLNDKVQQPNNNLLNRAGAAVMSIVNKAAEVLAKSNDNGRKSNETSDKRFGRGCVTLSHNILCQHCSSNERVELDDLISCKNAALSGLLSSNNGIRNHLVNSVTCHNVLGFDLKSDKPETNKNFIVSILPRKYIDALCNLLATDQKALPLRIEDIPGIHSNLISKKDEVSLKNVSKKEAPVEDPLCKHDFYTPPTETPELNPSIQNNTGEEENPPAAENIDEQSNKSLTGEELNIFNVVEQQKQEDASISTDNNSSSTEPLNEKPEESTKKDKAPEEIVKPEVNFELVSEQPQATITTPPEVSSGEVTETQAEVKVVEQSEVKAPQQEVKPEHSEKTNGDYRSSNPPESVFLRLSNRIKTLEKNMTLSAQYLEELSRRYKKQIEDLQHSFAKLQSLVDDQSNKKRENDKRDDDDKKRVNQNIADLNQKFEVILIVLVALFAFQTIVIVMLFKRISILRKACATYQQRQEKTEAPPASPSQTNGEKGRSTGRKRSKQRTRKISAPNILTQRSPAKNEFSRPQQVLNRTVSTPDKYIGTSPKSENKENYDEMKAMLEENDDILIPGFEDLKLNSDNESLRSNDLETTSTVSAVSSNEKHEQSSSNKSFKFKRRLSSPFQLKDSSLKKSSSDRTNNSWAKKAMSESPPRVTNEDAIGIQKSKSFHEDDEGTGKFKKSNSFKKLFKKLF